MRLPRLFIAAPLAVDRSTSLAEEHIHRLTRVLRLRAGARVRAFDGRGGEYEAELARDGRRWAITPLEHHPRDAESPFAITLVQSVTRGERMDFAIQKSVELGVAAIQPVIAARSVIGAGRRLAQRQAHWQRIVIQASEQCGRTVLARLHPPLAFAEWLHSAGSGIVLLPGAAHTLPELIGDAPGATLVIGPEGGLEPAELEAAQRAGLRAASLGPRILRTETAALVAISVLQARFGDLTPPRA